MAPQRWTQGKILQEIQDLWEAGESLATRNMSRLGYSGMVTAAYRPELFGGWRNAIIEAGLDPRKAFGRQRKWTQTRILSRIGQLHAAGRDLSYAAAKRDHQYLVIVASSARFFGSWGAAVEAAGLDYHRIRKRERWSRQKILERIREIHREGGCLTWSVARREHSALVAAAASDRYFGSWRAAVEAAGIDHTAIRGRRRPGGDGRQEGQ